MSDYDLGSAKGTIVLDYNGKGVDEAASGIEKVASGVGKFALGAVGAIAVVGGAIAGLALKGGIERALNIQDAQAKLTGLGNTAENVSAIMADALSAVKGTAFGLDTAATAAASAVAAGIQPGIQLQGYLKNVADAATIAGVGLTDMGRVFGKVAASNKAYNGDLQQLSDKGIPIYQYLAKQLNVTAGAVFDLASAGEISSAMFNKAISDNIGGAALASGATARGAFANLGAAMSRLGVSFVQPSINAAPKLLTAVGGAVDRLSAALAPVSEKIGVLAGDLFVRLATAIDKINFDAVVAKVIAMGKSFIDFINQLRSGNLDGAFGSIADTGAKLFPIFQGLIVGLSQVGGAVGSLIQSGLEAPGPLIQKFADAIQFLGDHPKTLAAIIVVLVGAFAAYRLSQIAANTAALLAIPIEITRTGLTLAQIAANVALAKAINGSAGATERATAADVFSAPAKYSATQAVLINTASVVANRIATVASTVATKAVAIALGIWTAAQWALNVALDANPIGVIILLIGAIIAAIVLLVVGIVNLVQHWGEVMSFFQTVWTQIVSFFTDAVNTITGLLDSWGVTDFLIATFTNLGNFFTDFWNGVVAVFNAVVGFLFSTFVTPIVNLINFVMTVFGAVANFIGGIIQSILVFMQPFTDFLINYIIPLVVAFWNLLVALFNFGVQLIIFIFQTLSDFIGFIIGAVVGFVVGAFQGMVDLVAGIINFFVQAVVIGFQALLAFVTPIFQGIYDFVSGVFQAIFDFVSGVVQNIVNFVMAVWGAFLGIIIPIIEPIFGFVSGVFQNIYNFVSGIVQAVVSFISSVWGTIVGFVTTIFNSVYNAIKNPIQDALDFVMGFKDKVIAFFTGAGKWLLSAGKDIIDGLIKGVKDGIKGLTDVLNNITSLIPKTKGPPEKDKVLLTPAGTSIMDGLIRGILSKKAELTAILTDMSLQVAPTFNTGLNDLGVNTALAGNVDQRQFTYVAAPGDGQVDGEDGLIKAMKKAKVLVPGW